MTMALVIFAAILIVLALTGNLNIDMNMISANVSNVLGVLAPLGVITLVSSIPFVASFVAGVFLGYRRY